MGLPCHYICTLLTTSSPSSVLSPSTICQPLLLCPDTHRPCFILKNNQLAYWSGKIELPLKQKVPPLCSHASIRVQFSWLVSYTWQSESQPTGKVLSRWLPLIPFSFFSQPAVRQEEVNTGPSKKLLQKGDPFVTQSPDLGQHFHNIVH